MSDADAFIRVILADLEDDTPKLVFADWLEESGVPANITWADYLRLQAEAARLPADDPVRGELLRRAGQLGRRVRARLTMRACHFRRHVAATLRLLPCANLTLDLTNLEVPRSVLELVPESVARENRVLPVQRVGRTLWSATSDPDNDDTAQKLEFILNMDVRFVRADEVQIREAIDIHYGLVETQSIDSYLYEFVDVAIEWTQPEWADPASPASVVRLVNLLLLEAANLQAREIWIEPALDGAQVRFRMSWGWMDRDPLPGQLLPGIMGRLRQMAGIEIAQTDRPQSGVLSVRLPQGLQTVRCDIIPTDDGPSAHLRL